MSMTKSLIEQLLDTVDWQAVEIPLHFENDDLPYATHTGQLHIGKCVLKCVQLNTGQRIITEDSIKSAIGI